MPYNQGMKTAKDATIYVRIDSKTKDEASIVFSRYGLSLSDAISIFLHKSILVRGLPFDLRDEMIADGAPAYHVMRRTDSED